ncbi:MAG: hypothetical protein IEMM0008_1101 [bacterium]|nr:MAG: hypothetical protein IEMM0008_1101 [bacterium]
MKTLLLIVQMIVMIYLTACEGSKKQSDTGYSKGSKETFQSSQSIDTPKSSKNTTSTKDSESSKDEVKTDESKEQDSERYHITASALILRDKPTRSSKIITRILRYESVSLIEKTSILETIAGKKAYWFKVQTIDEIQGYVFAAFLERIYDDLMSESHDLDVYWYIKENNVHIREKPNVKAKIARVCKAGDSFNIYQRTFKKVQIDRYKDYWYKTDFGWVFGAFITKDISEIELPYIKSVPKSYESLIGDYIRKEDLWAEYCVTVISLTHRTIEFSLLETSQVYYITDLKKLSRTKFKIKTKLLPIIDSKYNNKEKTEDFTMTLEPKKKRILMDGMPLYRWKFKAPKVYEQLIGSDWQGSGWKISLSNYSLILDHGHRSQRYGIIDVKELSERVMRIEAIELNPAKKRDYDKVINGIITVEKDNKIIEVKGSLVGDHVLKMKKMKRSHN